jgi:hypothetical protein
MTKATEQGGLQLYNWAETQDEGLVGGVEQRHGLLPLKCF